MLRKELEGVSVEVLGVADASLSIAQVTDVKTGSVNDLLTPGRNLRIGGHKLKIAGYNSTSGVWFAVRDTPLRIRVDGSDIVSNMPSELMIVIPELVVGTWQIEVVTKYGGTTLLKEPRTAMFDKPLTVN